MRLQRNQEPPVPHLPSRVVTAPASQQRPLGLRDTPAQPRAIPAQSARRRGQVRSALQGWLRSPARGPLSRRRACQPDPKAFGGPVRSVAGSARATVQRRWRSPGTWQGPGRPGGEVDGAAPRSQGTPTGWLGESRGASPAAENYANLRVRESLPPNRENQLQVLVQRVDVQEGLARLGSSKREGSNFGTLPALRKVNVAIARHDAEGAFPRSAPHRRRAPHQSWRQPGPAPGEAVWPPQTAICRGKLIH